MDTECSWDPVFESEGHFTLSPKDSISTKPQDEEQTTSKVRTPPVSLNTSHLFLILTFFTVISARPTPDENTLVSVSTSFHPTAQHHSFPPDLALLSSDSVFFYTYSPVLLAASKNSFASTLPLADVDATALRMHLGEERK